MNSFAMSLDLIDFDGGTQVRAAMDTAVVERYAERMRAGDVFPAVVVFSEDGHYYLADGFHRCLAAEMNGLDAVAVTVIPGTKTEALWYALGANKAHGLTLNDYDLSRAVTMALKAWPDKTQREIAAHVGCSQSLVCKMHTRIRLANGDEVRGRALIMRNKRARATEMITAGATSAAVRAALNLNTEAIAEIRRTLGVAPRLKRTTAAVADRRKTIAALTAQGHDVAHIEDQTGLSSRAIYQELQRAGLKPVATSIGRVAKHHADRIVGQMVMDAEHLTADVGLINYSELDHGKIASWIASLLSSRQHLNAFIRRLTKEQAHGQVG